MQEGHRQFLVGCGNNILCVADVGVPLHVRDVPCPALRKKPRDFERRVQVDDKEPLPSRDAMSLAKSNISTILTLPIQHHDWSG